jgi:chromosome segregation ATPase
MRSFVIFAATAAADAISESGNPVRRIVTFLQNMQHKIEKEAEEDEKAYQKFKCFCDGNTKDVSTEVQQATEKISELVASIDGMKASKSSSESDLSDKRSDVKAIEITMAQANKLREKEYQTYLEIAKEHTENLDAVKGALAALRGSGTSFAQMDPSNVARLRKIALLGTELTDFDKEALTSFLSREAPVLSGGSSQIVGILEQIYETMDKQLGGAAKIEEEKEKSHKALMFSKKSEKDTLDNMISTLETRIGQLAVKIVETVSDKKDTENSLNNNQRFLANLSINCKDKAKEMVERTKARDDETTTISEVISMLSSDSSSDSFHKVFSSRNQGISLIQEDRSRSRALKVLQSADSTGTDVSLLSYMLSSKKTKYPKVMAMIGQMMEHLKEAQKEDDKHIGFCRREFESTDDRKASLNRDIDASNSMITETKDNIEALTEELVVIRKGIADMTKDAEIATATRKEEAKKASKERIDMQDAKTLLVKAKNRLNKFYNPALHVKTTTPAPTMEERLGMSSGSFLQRQIPEAFAKKDQSSKSQEANGVLSLLDRLNEDLTQQLTEFEHDEVKNQRDYQTLISDITKKTEADQKTWDDKKGVKASLEEQLQSSKSDDKKLKTEILANAQYIKDLHAECDFLVEYYQHRKDARAGERETLQRAKAVLSGADLSFLQVNDHPQVNVDVDYVKIKPFGSEDTATELQKQSESAQETLVDAEENAIVSTIKYTVFRSLTRLRAAMIKEFDSIARLETHAIDAYNDAHHYRGENPINHLHGNEPPVLADKLASFH